MGKSSRPQEEENVAIVTGATSSEAFYSNRIYYRRKI